MIEALERWAGCPVKIQRILGGANSRVYCMEYDGRKALAKQYLPDHRDRLEREYRFLESMHRKGIRYTPEPYLKDAKLGLSVMEWIEGKMPSQVSKSEVSQAAEFFDQMQELEGEFPAASEACLSVSDYFRSIQKRVEKLKTVIRSDVLELLNKVEELTSALGSRARTIPEPRSRCLSPSDFGFHNAIQSGERVWFIDFEYAGWDDPAKMVADFFTQEKVPVPLSILEDFATRALQRFEDRGEILERAKRVLPLCQIKWALLYLNDLLPESKSRREFLGREREESNFEKAKESISNLEKGLVNGIR